MIDLTRGEYLFLGMVVFLVFGWAWMPKLGARIGGLFDK